MYSIPFLSFLDRSGLDKPSHNTIRLGGVWGKRLKVGEHVLIAHKHEVIGCSLVTGVHLGPLMQLLDEHARFNHVELALSDLPGYDPKTAPDRRYAGAVRNYGPHKVTPARLSSVIYLQPMRWENTKS